MTWAPVKWARPGGARVFHVFAAGETLSLCGSWVRTPTTPMLHKMAKDAACPYCWLHSRSPHYRDGVRWLEGMTP